MAQGGVHQVLIAELEVYCPYCGGPLRNIIRTEAPVPFRCGSCGQGWELLSVNGDSLVVSQADTYNSIELNVITECEDA